MSETTTPTQPSPFFTLPLELRNEIYALVYTMKRPSRDPNSKDISLYRLLGSEQFHRVSFFNRMIVCRQWYREAMDEFLRERTLRVGLASFCRTASNAAWKTSVRSFEIDLLDRWSSEEDDEDADIEDLGFQSLLQPFSNLHTLKLRVSDKIFRGIWPIEREESGDDDCVVSRDFASIPGMQDFLRAARGLRCLEILPMVDFLYQDRESERRWRERVRDLERWIQGQVGVKGREKGKKRK